MFYDFYKSTLENNFYLYTQRPEGHYTKSKTEEILGKLKKICREGSKEKEITYDQGGQNKLQLMFYLRYM